MNRSTSSLLQRKLSIAITLIVLVLFQLACATSTPEATATLPPADTATAAPTATLEPTATNTPVPTATNVPPTATPDKAATLAAKATAEAQEIVDLLADDLKSVGYSVDQGSLGVYLPDEVKLTTSSYGRTELQAITNEPVANFVLKTDVVWNSKSGLAGCVIGFRSEEDVVEGEQYRFYFLRLLNAPMWDIEYYDNGNFVTALRFLETSRSIDDSQDAQNTVILVVNGDDITPYINGDAHTTVSADQLSEGIVSLGVFQESGKTTCTYSNTWLWVLE